MTIKEKILTFMKEKGITPLVFSEVTGISYSNFKGKAIHSELSGDKIAKILTSYPELSADWLLMNKGEMIRQKEETIKIIHNPKIADTVIESQDILLYDIEAAANLNSLYLEQNKDNAEKIKIPNAPRCDGAMYVRGDSMYPLLKSGDIIAFKEVFNVEYLMYGEIYIISLEVDGDEYLTVKYINKSEREGYVTLVSYNNYYAPRDYPISSIRYLGLVKLSIRLNTL